MHPKHEPTDTTFRFEVFRYDAARNAPPRFQTYALDVSG